MVLVVALTKVNHVLMETQALVGRELIKWIRNPAAASASIIQPLIWIFIFGSSFNPYRLVPPELQVYVEAYLREVFSGAPNYVSFLAPGIMSLTVFFSAMFGGMSMIYDRRFGYLYRLLVSPISRASILASKAIASTVRGTVQALLILGASIPIGLGASGLGPMSILAAALVCVFLGLGFSSIYTTLMVRARDWQTGALVNNLMTMPLFFSSSALVPTSLFPPWLRPIAEVNPITSASEAMRAVLFQGQWGIFYQHLINLLLFDALSIVLLLLASRLLTE